MTRGTMVLVHGAWQGSWAWDAWVPELERRGWTVHAVNLPGNGCDPNDRTMPEQVSLGLYTLHVMKVVQACSGPVVLVGHSGGGITVSQVAEAMPDRIAAVVYLAGMMLPTGMRFADLVRQCQHAHPGEDLRGIGPFLQYAADGSTSSVPPQAALDIFVHDCEPKAAARAASLLRPQPERGRDMAPELTAERYGRVRRIYVEALRDRSLRLPVQRKMQQLSPGAHRLSIDCGHVPQLARPEELAGMLCPLLE